jgi:hypothetical protein
MRREQSIKSCHTENSEDNSGKWAGAGTGAGDTGIGYVHVSAAFCDLGAYAEHKPAVLMRLTDGCIQDFNSLLGTYICLFILISYCVTVF